MRRTIEVCGVIASGKTSVATALQDMIHAEFEEFSKNPFFEAFYQDPSRNAFETELTFALQHYHQIKVSASDVPAVCFDFSPELDLAYANLNLEGERLSI